MSVFNGKPTKEYLDAVTALKKLSLEERVRAYADATASDLRKGAQEEFGKAATGDKSWHKLLGAKAGRNLPKLLPRDDHFELWKGSELRYVSHPYGLLRADLSEIVKACDEHGLDVAVDARSWYFPGATLRVTYRRRSE